MHPDVIEDIEVFEKKEEEKLKEEIRKLEFQRSNETDEDKEAELLKRLLPLYRRLSDLKERGLLKEYGVNTLAEVRAKCEASFKSAIERKKHLEELVRQQEETIKTQRELIETLKASKRESWLKNLLKKIFYIRK